MTINTNVMSINAQRNASANNNSLATSLQRLSSGLRVNSAKDDAAGLAIASNMDAQARGMNVAIRNSNDGISLVQTAESGMAIIGDMLQRMRELAVQAANGTNTTNDLSALDAEYQELWSEIDRTLSSVEFNGTSLLDTSADLVFQIGANSGQILTVGSADLSVTAGIDAMSGQSALDTTDTSANDANIDAIDTAIQAINSSRATLGAIQNRFNYTVSFLQAASENQQAARGRIMDADFAQ
ncbi:MAG: flagellin FliC, partial [Betaproteobacteria bacterium]|nr:flagellin FliC [Betaproteobacteria bacterium]